MADTQAERNEELEQDALEYLRRRYPFAAELALMPKNAGQVPVFLTFETWVALVMTELATRQTEVDAAPDQPTWDAVEIDFAALTAADTPHLELRDFVRL